MSIEKQIEKLIGRQPKDIRDEVEQQLAEFWDSYKNDDGKEFCGGFLNDRSVLPCFSAFQTATSTAQNIALYAMFCRVILVQPLRQLGETLRSLADREHCIFTTTDLAAAVPECGQLAVLLSRAAKGGLLRRVCKGIYLYPVADYPPGNLLFHAAARLRADAFNYLSLETVLSDVGVISQTPINWISLMSSGRSHVVDCGDSGHIEFVHTAQRPDDVAGELVYDPDRHLWRASVRQALRDMKATRRSLELVDEEVLHELV